MKMKLVAAVLMLLTLGALGEVVKDFRNCKDFFHDGKEPEFGNFLSDARFVTICQRYENQYRYATLYDTTNKIPVYSAYTYKRTVDCKVKRPKITWMIEPQIGNKAAGGEMTLQKQTPKSNLQAYNSDYEGSGYHKGHLYPNCHAPDEETAESTFTLTNAAPQIPAFNIAWYYTVEKKVKNALADCVNTNRATFVVTGVVPNTNSEYLSVNSKVNVPTHFWTVYCCCDKKNCQFRGYIMQKEVKTEEFTGLKEFNEILSKLYNKTFKVWYSC